MVINSDSQIDLHFETLPKETKMALDFLSEKEWLKNSPWYLAGGTALALNVGNRKSYDLDFFTQEKDINNEDVLSNFFGIKEWEVTMDRKNTIYGELFGAKVSFIAYPFFVPKEVPKIYGSVKIIAPIDVAVMKIVATSQRGRKRDFFDLYWCAQNIAPLEEIIRKLPEQYPSVVQDYHHILKALTYFEDAETDPEPEIYFNADWTKVKNFFEREVVIVGKKLMGLD